MAGEYGRHGCANHEPTVLEAVVVQGCMEPAAACAAVCFWQENIPYLLSRNCYFVTAKAMTWKCVEYTNAYSRNFPA